VSFHLRQFVLFAALGMGVLISAVTHSQQIAFQVAIIASLLPAIIMSGLIFPLRNMPLPIQGVSLVVVPRYFVAILRGIILKNAPFADLWREFAALGVLGLLFNLLAARRVKKRI